MQTYELTLDDSPKAQLLLELLRGMDVVKQIRRKDFTGFATAGEPLSVENIGQMVAAAEEDIANGNTYTSDQVRKLLGR